MAPHMEASESHFEAILDAEEERAINRQRFVSTNRSSRKHEVKQQDQEKMQAKMAKDEDAIVELEKLQTRDTQKGTSEIEYGSGEMGHA